MAQKHLQLLRNGSAYANYQAAYQELTGKTSYADGTPILARYSGETGEIKTLLGVVNKAVTTPRVDIINDVQASILRAYNLEEATSGAIATNDSIEVALNKLENQVIAAKAAATTKVVEGTDTGNNMTIVPTTGDDNSVTYTVNLTDVASKNALDAEIQARKDVDGQTGQTYAANPNANYISTATSLNDADVKLDAALKAEETARKEIEGQNGSAYTQNADSRYISGASNMNDADVKLDQAVSALSDNLDNIVEGLSAGTVFDENKVVVDVTQEDGKITATAANLTGVKLNGYTEGTDADIAATDTLGQALGKLQAQINAMDKTASAVDGQVVTTVVETDGKVTETKANVKDLQLGGYVKDTAATGAIGGTDTINTALSKLENTVTANKIGNTDGSINVTTGTTGTDINVNIKADEHVLAKDGNAGLYTNIAISSVTGTELTDLGTNVKEAYKLVGTDNTKLGEYIKIYKDSSISKIYLGYPTDTVDANSGTITSGATGEAQSLNYVYHKEDGTYEMVRVDVSRFLAESEFASGVTADANGVVHGVVDTASEKDESEVAFLTVGAYGFKVSGIKDAIDTKINKLDVTGDTVVAGQYVAAIQEADGIVSVKTRANVSDAVLTGYAKGEKPASTAIAATDDVKGAIAKLEHQIDDAKAAATTKVEKDAAASHLTLTSSTAADGSVTYIIGESDIASKTDLDAEIAARKAVDGINGDSYTANTGINYITGATSLNNADVLLDTALKALNDETIKTITSTANTGCTVEVTGSGNTRNIAVNTDGAQVKLTGYEATGATGAPVATDSVNAAIAKLYNRGTITSTNSGITVDQSGSATTLTLNVSTDAAAAGTTGATYAQKEDGNAIELRDNGIFVSSNWDCGTYDEPASN